MLTGLEHEVTSRGMTGRELLAVAFDHHLAMLSTGYQLLSIWCQLKQLVQYYPVEQPAKSQAEQQGRQEREPYRGRRTLLLLASAMPVSITAIIEVAS